MARTKTPNTEISLVSTEEQQKLELAVATKIETATQEFSEHSEKILAEFGDGEDFFELRRYEYKVREELNRGALAMVNAGRYLIVIKEHSPHGDWLQSLDRLGLAPRHAQKLMQASVKFLASSGSKKVLEHASNKTKALELLMLDDEELEQLGEGKTVAGITLDDVDRMSSTELRKALREAREEADAKEKVAAAKQKQIDKLEVAAERAKLNTLPWSEVVAPLAEEIANHQAIIDKALDRHLQAISAIDVWHTGLTKEASEADPYAHVALPQEAITVLMGLEDAINRSAHAVAAIRDHLQNEFGAVLMNARRHLLIESEE